jgi:hypothetical protein
VSIFIFSFRIGTPLQKDLGYAKVTVLCGLHQRSRPILVRNIGVRAQLQQLFHKVDVTVVRSVHKWRPALVVQKIYLSSLLD